MRNITAFIFCVILLITAADSAWAYDEGPDVTEAQYGALNLDGLSESVTGGASGMLDGLEISAEIDFNKGINQILEAGGSELGGILRKAARSAVLIIIIAILCSIAEIVFESASSTAPGYVSLAGVLAISAVTVGDVSAFVGLGRTLLSDLSMYSKTLLPTLAAAAAGSGAVSSAPAKYAAAALFMDLLLTLSTGVLIPVIYAYVAAAIAEAAVGGEAVAGASSFLKWLATTMLTIIMLAFILYLGLSGIVSSSADAAAVRLAKTTLSTTLPVVGSIISDAAASVLAGASVLKNAIGVFGMLAVIALCLIPFLQLAAHYIFYKAASKLSASVAGGRISKLIGGISSAFGLVMGLTGACALMIFFSLISLIKVVA